MTANHSQKIPEPSYFGDLRDSVTTIFDGMAITMSHMFRPSTTIQYPYHPRDKNTPIGGADTLPDRYRGLLEVDMDICTACLACERSCPIDCIKIDVEKVTIPGEEKEVRAMVRFDIDEAKCMFCGLCQEPCPTNAIRHTTQFESTVANLEHLVARFVEPEAPVVPFKVKKGVGVSSAEHGSIAQALYVDRQWDLPAIDFPSIPRAKKKSDAGPPDPFSQPLTKLASTAKGVDVPRLSIILEESMAATDCGTCEYPTCKEYAEAIARGDCMEFFRCEPGGTDAQIEATQIMMVYKGTWETDLAANTVVKSGAGIKSEKSTGDSPSLSS